MDGQVAPNGSVAVLRPEGELDVATVGSLREALLEACSHHALTIIDLAAVTFIDSTTVGVLISAAKRCQHDGGEVQVVNATGFVLKVLTVLGVTKMLGVGREATDLEESRELLAP